MVYCKKCGKNYKDTDLIWRCACGSYLSLSDSEFTKTKIIERERSIWRYKKMLAPINDDCIVSLGEGCTPLIREEFFGFSAELKLDYISATGSYKDRGVSFMVSAIKQLGVKRVVEDSSGNAGASIAAYAAKAGIECRVYAPDHTSANKLAQITAMGAEAIAISGTREDVAQAACKDSSGFYASHNWSVYFQEGMKTLAYELLEQTGDVPDNYVVPLGYGSLITGPAAGFNALKASGTTGKLPRLFGVQSANCCPMYDYFYGRAAGKEYGKTIAEGIASLNPIKKDEIALAISQSEGSVVLAEDGECLSAMKQCAGKGIFIEPTSAVAVAGFIKLCADGTIKKGEKTVIILTGSGLKDIKTHG